MLPSFYKIMTFKEKVVDLLNEGLEQKPSVFLIDLTITDSNKNYRNFGRRQWCAIAGLH